MSKINWEEVSMAIITSAGLAKSHAMEALFAAKKGDFNISATKISKANKEIGNASHKHFDVITTEASGENLEFKVLFIHAEDQLLTTQTLILMIEGMIDIWKEIKK